MKSNPTKLDFLGTFSSREDVSLIKILGHTGKSIFSALENFARLRGDVGLRNAVHVHLLLRDEGVETPKRREQIAIARRTIRRLNDEYSWLHVEIRFYSAIQTLRGAIVELTGGEKSIYCSAYQWALPNPTKLGYGDPYPIKTSAVKWATVTDFDSNKEEITGFPGLLENWFDYYWGTGLIHTVAFDFDDTLIDTYKEKIEAWIAAIAQTLKKFGGDHFRKEFLSEYPSQPKEQFNYLKAIVDMYPGKGEILLQVLEQDTPPRVFKFLDEARSSFREGALFPKNKTKEVLTAHVAKKLFPGVRPALESLAWRGYSLAVASLTDEERIEKALEIANIPCINTIVGSAEYRNRELPDYLAEKVYLLRKIANLAGVPVSRVLYIGDHHRDEHAANEVGASFVHARLLPQIEPSSDPDTLYFEDYGKLAKAVDEIESRVMAREIAPQKRVNYA